MVHSEGRGKQTSELEASLAYRASSRTAGGYTEKPYLKKPKPNQPKKKKQPIHPNLKKKKGERKEKRY